MERTSPTYLLVFFQTWHIDAIYIIPSVYFYVKAVTDVEYIIDVLFPPTFKNVYGIHTYNLLDAWVKYISWKENQLYIPAICQMTVLKIHNHFELLHTIFIFWNGIALITEYRLQKKFIPSVYFYVKAVTDTEYIIDVLFPPIFKNAYGIHVITY